MKKIILFALAALAATTAGAQHLTVDRVVANVGNGTILYSEVEEAAKGLAEQYRAMGRTSQRDLFHEALEGLMERKLSYYQALVDSLTIDESAVLSQAGDMLKAQIAEAGGVRELEQQQNMTIFDIQKGLEQRTRESDFADQMHYEAMGGAKVQVTPGEVELFFRKFPKDSIPTVPEQYMYGQITRFPASMKEAKERVREQLMGMRADVIGGKSKFETLARLYSEDTGANGTASAGGELPPLELESMDPAWQAAVERLRPGQISEVVETEYGLQIIQLIEGDGKTYRLRYIPMRPKYSTVEMTVGTEFLDSLARVIRADSITFEEAARLYSDDAASRQNGGIATNTEMLQLMQGGRASGGQMVFKFRKEDFEYNIRDFRELSALKVGEVSNAYTTRDLHGNDLSKIVKLLAVYPTHEANLAEDYLALEQAALAAKQKQNYDRWLNKTIDATYVRIDPAYRDPAKWQNKRWLK